MSGLEQVEVKVKLPKYLADWAYEFSKDMDITLDTLVANLLRNQYDIWRLCDLKYRGKIAQITERLRKIERDLREALGEVP